MTGVFVTAIVLQVVASVGLVVMTVILGNQRNAARADLRRALVQVHSRDVQLSALWPHVTCKHLEETRS